MSIELASHLIKTYRNNKSIFNEQISYCYKMETNIAQYTLPHGRSYIYVYIQWKEKNWLFFLYSIFLFILSLTSNYGFEISDFAFWQKKKKMNKWCKAEKVINQVKYWSLYQHLILCFVGPGSEELVGDLKMLTLPWICNFKRIFP